MNRKHLRYLDLAKHFSTWSKDPSKKIGAVIIGDKDQVVSQGFNGFPRKFDDSFERFNNRELKYKYVIHAEMNAIYNAGFTGTKIEGSTLYVHGLPVCHECAKGIIQTGIKTVVMDSNPINSNERWKESGLLALELFKEANVEVLIIEEPHSTTEYVIDKSHNQYELSSIVTKNVEFLGNTELAVFKNSVAVGSLEEVTKIKEMLESKYTN